jgi:hypothetical protein
MRSSFLPFVISVILSTAFSWVAEGEPPTQVNEDARRFKQLCAGKWREVFHDPCTVDWRENWTLDGLKAKVVNSAKGMDFHAGPGADEDASHAVLWTKPSFTGDLKIEYEFTRLDTDPRYVVILYVQATGSDVGPYAKDIAQWANLRKVPAMRTYFDNMNTYHLSYAAFGNKNAGPGDDYIRARRYMPAAGQGLKGTELEGEQRRTGLFKTGVPHRIIVIKKGNELFMHIQNDENELLCHWNNSSLPPILEGRVGLRHMCTRAARYRDFRVSLLESEVGGIKKAAAID